MSARPLRLSTRTFLASGTFVALLATTGSLYFSLGLGLHPCELCWYQRVLMYPLVIVLGVATVENRIGVYRTALPLSLLGGAIAAYHSYLQRTVTICSFGGMCASIQWQTFGVTIPNLSLIAFVLIILALVGAVRYSDASAGSTTSSVSG
jgi:disulfide bond formation protein DsbB